MSFAETLMLVFLAAVVALGVWITLTNWRRKR